MKRVSPTSHLEKLSAKRYNTKVYQAIGSKIRDYIGDPVVARELVDHTQNNRNWLRRTVDSVFGVNVDGSAKRAINDYFNMLKHTKEAPASTDTIKNLSQKILEANNATGSGATKKYIGAGLLGLGGGTLATHYGLTKAHKKQLEKEKQLAAAQGLGIGMALPRSGDLQQMAYPDDTGY